MRPRAPDARLAAVPCRMAVAGLERALQAAGEPGAGPQQQGMVVYHIYRVSEREAGGGGGINVW